MKFLKANPQVRIEETIKEKPLLHACSGLHPELGDVTLDIDSFMESDIKGDVTKLPIKDDSFAAAYMDCPWTASWKKNVADAIKELLRVAPVVYVLGPFTYGSRVCKITNCQVAWTPGVNQALLFTQYKRNGEENNEFL